MDRQLTWEDFLDIRFNHHMDLEKDTPTSSTALYSAITSPPAGSYLRQSGSNPTIVPRILDSFRSLLEDKGILDQPLPAELATSLERFQWELSRTTISTVESSALLPVITRAVEALTDRAFTVTQHPTLRQYMQQGGINWKTIAVATNTPVKSTTIGAKQPRVMFHHATDMQNEYEYEPHIAQYNAKAICSKAWLQLSTCNPASQYGVLYSGLSAVVLERGLYASNHHALHVSPHYHVFRDDNPPTTAEYGFINELNRCEKGIPLLAVLTYILLPNTSVRQDVHPAIRNPITFFQQKTAAQPFTRRTTKETRTPIETPITTSAGVSEAAINASIVSLSFEHPDVAGLPRLLYPQMLQDEPPNDTSPLSPSSIHSTGADTELPSSPPPLVDVQLFQRITIGNFAQVWRGSLTDSQGTVTSVVAKMYSQRYFEAMNKETRAYRLLSRHHLDSLAPVHYGTFTMPDESWGAVILSDVGDAFQCHSWKEAGMSAQELRTIWKYVNALHSIGLHHHDVEPRNIAKDRNGILRILDFERSSLDDSCPCGELEGLGQFFDSLMEWR